MKKEDIIELGTALGLPFNIKDNYQDMLKKDIVVFNGVNNQRFLIDGSDDTKTIYREIGTALIKMGMRQKAKHLHDVLSIISDTTDLPYFLKNEQQKEDK